MCINFKTDIDLTYLDDIEIQKVINKIKKLKIDDIEFDDELQEKISFF